MSCVQGCLSGGSTDATEVSANVKVNNIAGMCVVTGKYAIIYRSDVCSKLVLEWGCTAGRGCSGRGMQRGEREHARVRAGVGRMANAASIVVSGDAGCMNVKV